MKSTCYYIKGIKVLIWYINSCSFTWAQVKLQRWIAMLSYQSQNLEILSLLYHFGEDSTLVPRTANVRGWSKHRFQQRLWSACMRWNQSDFHQFSWSPAFSDIIFIHKFNLFTPTADFLFLTLKSWFSSCMQPAKIADIHFGKPPHLKGKKPILLFSLVKNFISNLWLVRCLFFTCEKPYDLSEFVQFITNDFLFQI